MSRKRTTSCGTIPYRVINSTVEILLIKPHSKTSCWGFPKGHIDNQESFEECAIRETFEETGYHVKIEQKLPETITKNKNEIKTVHSYLSTIVGGDISLSDPDDEIEEIGWFNINRLPNIYNYQQNVIDAAVALLRNKLNNNI